jgi:hypothetical protein
MVENMKIRPPEMIAWLVRTLVPSASREHVVGDLNERYASPGQYLLDALRALPYLIASRLRRTTHPIGLILGGLFLWWAVFYGSRQNGWLVATIPTVVTLLVLSLRDVYRGITPKWRRAAAMDIALSALAVLLSQAVLAVSAPTLVLDRAALLVGFPLGFIVLFFVRLQSPSGLNQPPAPARSITMQEIRAEIDTAQTTTRRAVRVEIGACIVVALCFTIYALWLPATPIGRIGYGLIAAAALFIWWFLRRYAHFEPIPAGLGFKETVAAYRHELERRRQLSRSYAYWYVAPLGIGFVVLFVGRSLQHPNPIPDLLPAIVVIAGLGAALTLIHSSMAAKVARRIEQLESITEKVTAS